jgi:hypothetical protein
MYGSDLEVMVGSRVVGKRCVAEPGEDGALADVDGGGWSSLARCRRRSKHRSSDGRRGGCGFGSKLRSRSSGSRRRSWSCSKEKLMLRIGNGSSIYSMGKKAKIYKVALQIEPSTK